MTRTTFSSRFHLRSHFIGGSKTQKPPIFTKTFKPTAWPTDGPPSRLPARASICHVHFAPWSPGTKDMKQTEPVRCIWYILLTYPVLLSRVIKSVPLGARPTPGGLVGFSDLTPLVVKTVMLPSAGCHEERRRPGTGKPSGNLFFPISSLGGRCDTGRNKSHTREGVSH